MGILWLLWNRLGTFSDAERIVPIDEGMECGMDLQSADFPADRKWRFGSECIGGILFYDYGEDYWPGNVFCICSFIHKESHKIAKECFLKDLKKGRAG